MATIVSGAPPRLGMAADGFQDMLSVGAVVLSRAVDDTASSDELLLETRAWIAATQPAVHVDQDEDARI